MLTKELLAVAPSERVVAPGWFGHTLLDHHQEPRQDHLALKHLLDMTPSGPRQVRVNADQIKENLDV